MNLDRIQSINRSGRHKMLEDRERLTEMLTAGTFSGLRLRANEITIIVSVIMGSDGPYPRSELRRMFDAGYFIEPKSYRSHVNGMIRVNSTRKFQEEISVLRTYLAL